MKEQRPGFTGFVKRVDTVAQARVVAVDTWGDTCMVKFSDSDCVSRPNFFKRKREALITYKLII